MDRHQKESKNQDSNYSKEDIKRYRLIERAYTTGEIACIWGVSVQSVKKCIDEGYLRAFTLPQSGWRRVANSELVDVMIAHNIPLSGLDRYVHERKGKR